MGEGMKVFVEYRVPSGDPSANPWELDLPMFGPVDEQFGARGVVIPRGRSLYYMMGYPDDDCPADELHLSKPVETNRWNLAGADTFWTIKTTREVEIIRRCFAVSANIHPNDVDDSDTWKVSIGKVYHRMVDIEKEGFEARLIVHIE